MERREIKPLLIDTNPISDLIVDEHENPIWPIRTTTEYEAIQRFSCAFGVPLEETKGRAWSQFGGQEWVLGIGDHVTLFTKIYAHLTQRRFASFSGMKRGDTPFPSVVICRPADLTQQLVEYLYSSELESEAPGIIFAESDHDLRLQVLVRAASSLSRQIMEESIVDFYPNAPISLQKAAGRTIVGGSTARNLLREVLGNGAQVLSVIAHSDGIDADFGQLVLCSLKNSFKTLDTTELKQSPACLASAICHRLNLRLDDAIGSSDLLSADGIVAHLLILRICHGLFLFPSLVNPSYAISSKLALSPTIGALLTSWGQLLTSVRDIEPLLSDLELGMPIGIALSRYNRLDGISRTGQRLCLIGDPRTRLSHPDLVCSYSSQEIAQLEYVSDNANFANEPPRPDLPGIALLQAYVNSHVKQGFSFSEISDAQEQIADYQMCAWNGGNVEDECNLIGENMRIAILKVALQSGSRLSKYWEQFNSRVFSMKENLPCPNCGQDLTSIVADLRVLGAETRRRRTCVCCGEIEDAPLGFPELSIQREGTVVNVRCAIPERARTLAFLVDPKNTKARSGSLWEKNVHGKNCPEIKLTTSLPSGLLYFSALAISGASIAMARVPLQHNSNVKAIRLIEIVTSEHSLICRNE
jgi:hypothetical protein